MSYDNVCKYLAEQYPVAFADWLLAIESGEVEVLKTELTLEPIRADAVSFLRIANQILHIEFQTLPYSNQPIPFRMLDYSVRLKRQNISGCTEILAGLRFEKDLIRRFLREDIMRGSVIYQDILQQGAFKLIRSQLNWRLGEIESALLERVRELSPEQLDNLAVALFNFSEVRDLADWLDQQQPRERTVDLIVRQLKRRLGEVEPVLIEQVRRLPIAQLEALAEALLDFSEVSDLVNWLEQLR